MSFAFLMITAAAPLVDASSRPEKQVPISINRSSKARPRNNRARWVTTSDYPAAALEERAEGTTTITLTVGSDGTVKKCKVAGSSGNIDLDLAACSSASERAQFYPARDKNGKTVSDSYTTRVRWQIPSVTPIPLPKSRKSVLSYTIEKDGSISNCKLEVTPPLEDPATNPCDFIGGFEPPTNKDGNAVRKNVAIAAVIKVQDVEPKD